MATQWAEQLQVGASPGTPHIGGVYTKVGGTIRLDAESDGMGGFLTSTLLFDVGADISITDADIQFVYSNGADPIAFRDSGSGSTRRRCTTTGRCW